MNFHTTVRRRTLTWDRDKIHIQKRTWIYDSLNKLKVNQKENENSGPSNATKTTKFH